VEIIPDQYIVVYKDNFMAASAANSIKTMVEANGGEMKFMYGAALNGFAAYLPQKALDIILADPNVDYVEADGIMTIDQDITAQTVQTNPTWGLDRIDQRVMPFDHQYGFIYNGTGVRVYVLDTGVRSTHTQFGGRAYKVYDAIGDGQNGNDCNGPRHTCGWHNCRFDLWCCQGSLDLCSPCSELRWKRCIFSGDRWC
jgi:subtilisin family serine protease